MTWRFDAHHSQVEWACRYLGISTIKGSFETIAAQVSVDQPDPSTWSITAEIDPRSVACAGLPRLVEALHGEHFLEVEKYPEMRFRSTRFDVADNQLRIHGELTLHGVTRPIVIAGSDNGEAMDGRGVTHRGFSGTARVLRSDFGIPGTTQFVADEVDVSIEVQLSRV